MAGPPSQAQDRRRRLSRGDERPPPSSSGCRTSWWGSEYPGTANRCRQRLPTPRPRASRLNPRRAYPSHRCSGPAQAARAPRRRPRVRTTSSPATRSGSSLATASAGPQSCRTGPALVSFWSSSATHYTGSSRPRETTNPEILLSPRCHERQECKNGGRMTEGRAR
jgi:hypothetical protein